MIRDRHVCLYQDSIEHYVSTQAAILSIREHESEWKIHVYLTRRDTWFTDWLTQTPNVHIHDAKVAQNGFNAKPVVINHCLSLTKAEVIWFDSDMILTRPLSPTLDAIPDSHCLAAENPPGDWPDGSEMRTRGWGFVVGRSVSETVNSCIVRFNEHHHSLACAWVNAVTRDDYVAAQAQHWSERPAYFLGDQDALGALLGSKQFESVGLSLLKNGKQIAQCFKAGGYSWRHRVVHAFSGLPPIIHAQGDKPWIVRDDTPVYLDVCTYKLFALRYQRDLHDRNWLSVKSPAGKILVGIFRGSPILSGLLPAMLEEMRRTLGRLIHPLRGRKFRGISHKATRT